MNTCRVCTLDDVHRKAVDEALASGLPLYSIARRCGITRSSLHRHLRNHISSAAALNAKTPLPVVDKKKPVTLQIVPEPDTQAETKEVVVTRQDLLERVQWLWGEGRAGLESSKEPIPVTRSDGSTVELKGDLRARKGFLSELRELVRLEGEVSGVLVRGQHEPGFGVQIVLPPPLPQTSEPEGYVIEIGLPPRRS